MWVTKMSLVYYIPTVNESILGCLTVDNSAHPP